jgi:hypothetical protein
MEHVWVLIIVNVISIILEKNVTFLFVMEFPHLIHRFVIMENVYHQIPVDVI